MLFFRSKGGTVGNLRKLWGTCEEPVRILRVTKLSNLTRRRDRPGLFRNHILDINVKVRPKARVKKPISKFGGAKEIFEIHFKSNVPNRVSFSKVRVANSLFCETAASSVHTVWQSFSPAAFPMFRFPFSNTRLGGRQYRQPFAFPSTYT
jgi:hypothetical protein